MARKTQHVVPNIDGGWSVKKSDGQKASRNFDTKDEAVVYGRKISKNQNADLFIHAKSGKIVSRVSYAADPMPPKKGTK